MKKLNTVLVCFTVLALFGAGLAAAAAIPQAPGTNVACQGFKGHKVQFPQGPIFTIPSSGLITSRVGNSFQTPSGLEATSLEVVAFNDNGRADGVGEFSFNLDTSRPQGQSWVQANKDGSLTQVMNFHMTARVEALGNEELHTAKAPTLAADLNKFPESGAVYSLLSPIEFVNEKGEVKLIVHDATVQMTDTQSH